MYVRIVVLRVPGLLEDLDAVQHVTYIQIPGKNKTVSLISVGCASPIDTKHQYYCTWPILL